MFKYGRMQQEIPFWTSGLYVAPMVRARLHFTWGSSHRWARFFSVFNII